MLTAFIRTGILFVFIVISLRLMGKRQIGQLQPAELVITILLSEMAATPMQDNDIPMLNTLVSISVLTALEIIMSALSLKSSRLRNLLQGHSVIVVKDGVPDEKQLRRLRFSVDDLLEALRQKDVFDISQVKYAVAETDGSLSVLLKSEDQPLTAADMGIKKPEKGFPAPLVMDGEINFSDITEGVFSKKEILKAVENNKVKTEDIFILTLDEKGNKVLVKKEKKR